MEALKRSILLSRQRDDAEPLAAALLSAGFTALVWPALRLELRPPTPELRDAMLAAEVLALPSPYAIRSLLALIAEFGLSITDLAAPIWVSGAGSAAALPDGTSCDYPMSPYAEDLAQAIAAAHPNAAVTIICGDQARPNLVAELTAQGCRPVPLVMYHNRPPADLARDPIDLHAAIYHSPSAAQRQLHANPWLRHVPAVAVGKTTAAALQSGDHQQVIIAQSPAIAAIIAAVESL